MIMDRLANAELYFPVHPRFAAAFRYLRETDLEKLADGEHEIDGRRLFAAVATSPGRGRAGAKLEAHRKYIDIQYVVRGTDDIGLKPTCECRDVELPYTEDHDASLYLDKPTNWVTVPTGSFTIFYPDDGHAPLGTSEPVKKVVVKVQIDD